MATPFTPVAGSASISGTEFSLPNGSTTLTPQTTACKLEAWIDASAVLAGDQYRVQILEKVNGGTQAVAWEGFITGATPQLYVLPVRDVNEGWDVRVKLIAGSARTIAWALKQDIGDRTALTIATGAITATAIATDAIDADALKADAITEIQSGLALAATAVSNADYTAGRAAKLDNLDATITSRSSAAAIAAVQADTDDIQTRIPAALDGAGNMKAGVQTIASEAITAAAIAADAGAELAAAVWAFAHQSGRTAKGALKRLDQLLTGKHTGMLGALWTMFDVDGTTPIVRAAQDTAAGTRDAASIVAGD